MNNIRRISVAFAVSLALSSFSIAQIGAQQPSDDATVSKPQTGQVKLTVSVMNRNQEAALGLTREDFSLTENNEPRKITSFSVKDKPVSVAIVYDLSGSINNLRLKGMSESLALFLARSNPENEYSVISFSDQPGLVLDRVRDREAAESVLTELVALKPVGASADYDACRLGLLTLGKSEYSKRILLVISDGVDTSSRLKLKDFSDLLKHSDATVYTLAVGDYHGRSPFAGGMTGQSLLTEMAKMTGGLIFVPKDDRELGAGLNYLAYELRHQYLLGYVPGDSTDVTKARSITIKVAPIKDGKEQRGLVVRSRSEVFVTQN